MQTKFTEQQAFLATGQALHRSPPLPKRGPWGGNHYTQTDQVLLAAWTLYIALTAAIQQANLEKHQRHTSASSQHTSCLIRLPRLGTTPHKHSWLIIQPTNQANNQSISTAQPKHGLPPPSQAHLAWKLYQCRLDPYLRWPGSQKCR